MKHFHVINKSNINITGTYTIVLDILENNIFMTFCENIPELREHTLTKYKSSETIAYV